MEYWHLSNMLYFLYFLEEVVHSLISIYPPYLSGHPLEFIIEREEKYGGIIKYTVYQDLEDDYAKQELYPLDLKNAVARELNKVFFIYCIMSYT